MEGLHGTNNVNETEPAVSSLAAIGTGGIITSRLEMAVCADWKWLYALIGNGCIIASRDW